MKPGWKKSVRCFPLAALVLLSTALNLRLMPRGHHYDLFLFQSWGNRALAEGLPSLYREKLERDFSPETTNHPPLHPYLLQFDAWLNYRLYGDNRPLSAHYLVISKMIPFLANTAIGLLIFFYCRPGNGYKAALAAAAAYLLNPALIYVVSYWGQADPVGSLLMLGSVLLLMKDRPLASTACLTLAALFQLRAVMILPVLAWVMVGEYGWKKIWLIILVNAALVFAVCLPYLAAGQARHLLKVATDTAGMYPYVSCKTYNLWYLLSPHTSLAGVLADTTRVAGVSLRTAGWLMFGLYTALVIFRQKDNRDLPLAAAAVCFAFYMLPTRIHSRYLFPFLVFFPLSIGRDWRYWVIYCLLSLNCLLNLMMILPFPQRGYCLFSLIQSVRDSLTARYSATGIGVAVSAVNLVLFLFFSWIVLGRGLFAASLTKLRLREGRQ